MARIIIAEREGGSDLSRRIDRELDRLTQAGVNAEVTCESRGGSRFFTCRIASARRGEPFFGDRWELFRFGMACAVSETIVCDVEPQLLWRGVSHRARGAPLEERRRVAELARDEMEQIALDERSERANLTARICDYFSEEEALHLDGFLRFRLKGYREELARSVEAAIRRYKAECEQREFVALLRFLLEHQEPRVDLVHIFPKPGGSFSLLDGEGCAINHQYLEGFVFDLAADGEVNLEDLLISALVTLSPVRIVLHPPAPVWDTAFLREVFQERLVSCRGCRLCIPAPLTAGKPRST